MELIPVIIIIGLITFATNRVLSEHNKEQTVKAIKDEFQEEYKRVSPVLKDFIGDCTNIVYKSPFLKSEVHQEWLDMKINVMAMTIYSTELAFHIVALWLANLDARKATNTTIVITAVIMYLYHELGYDKGNDYSYNDFKTLILNRKNLILTEKDFEVRNFNFLCMCNNEIKAFEDKNKPDDYKLMISDVSNLPVVGGNPMTIPFLPSVYKDGFVKKYLDHLDSLVL